MIVITVGCSCNPICKECLKQVTRVPDYNSGPNAGVNHRLVGTQQNSESTITTTTSGSQASNSPLTIEL